MKVFQKAKATGDEPVAVAGCNATVCALRLYSTRSSLICQHYLSPLPEEVNPEVVFHDLAHLLHLVRQAIRFAISTLTACDMAMTQQSLRVADGVLEWLSRRRVVGHG